MTIHFSTVFTQPLPSVSVTETVPLPALPHITSISLFEIATGWQIAKEAQPQPPVRLVNRFDNADKIRFQNPHRSQNDSPHGFDPAQLGATRAQISPPYRRRTNR